MSLIHYIWDLVGVMLVVILAVSVVGTAASFALDWAMDQWWAWRMRRRNG